MKNESNFKKSDKKFFVYGDFDQILCDTKLPRGR